MKKILSIILMLFFLVSCAQNKEIKTVDIRPETKETKKGGYLTSFVLDGHEIYLCEPEDLMRTDLINYGFSAPFIMVFPDEKMNEEEAVDLIYEEGIDVIAQRNGGFVLFVNPIRSWEKEESGIYERIMEKTAVGISGFSHGLIHDEKADSYSIFASPAATTVFASGKGADYIAKNYLKQVKGTSSLSMLGSDDITLTAAVLKGLSVEPQIECEDIIVIKEEDLPFDELFDRDIAGYQRWNGKLAETYYPGKNGILMEPLSFEVKTSDDNTAIKTETYELGAVVFRKEDPDQKEKPLLLCFHGGGDTAITTASIAGWPQIAYDNDFILCAIENHMRTTATEVMEVIEQLKQIYSIDEKKIYATGFSMGSIKTWDLYQKYPEVFAALAPMGASVDVGKNCQFSDSPFVNEEVMVPVFYSGGENSPLGELPFQSFACVNRINYLMKVNGVETPFEISMANRSEWSDSIYGYEGDIVEQFTDDSFPESVTTIRYYQSKDGQIYTALCSISHHAHEIRPFTCEKAWEFMSCFSRVDEKIVVDDEKWLP
ncbi:MAG: hypothetical protein IKS54_09715 [Erysipelotrichaceae bacterium]|nr:hypothetical protein [Erysipelotrichaceae bacterium]